MQVQNSITPVTKAAAGPKMALVVEDEETDRFRLITLCRRAGLDLAFKEAEDSHQMRAEIAANTFDVIFIDYHLGFSNGLEAVAEIVACERQNNAVLIMVTSVNQHEVIIESMKSGCSDFLIKEELSIDGIRRSVETALGIWTKSTKCPTKGMGRCHP